MVLCMHHWYAGRRLISLVMTELDLVMHSSKAFATRAFIWSASVLLFLGERGEEIPNKWIKNNRKSTYFFLVSQSAQWAPRSSHNVNSRGRDWKMYWLPCMSDPCSRKKKKISILIAQDLKQNGERGEAKTYAIIGQDHRQISVIGLRLFQLHSGSSSCTLILTRIQMLAGCARNMRG